MSYTTTDWTVSGGDSAKLIQTPWLCMFCSVYFGTCIRRRIYQAVAGVSVVLHNDTNTFQTYSPIRLGAERHFRKATAFVATLSGGFCLTTTDLVVGRLEVTGVLLCG